MKTSTPKILLWSLTLLLGIFSGVARAQWNTNTSENLQISGLPTSDMMTVSTTDNKMWVAFYHENAGNYDMRAQLFDADGNKLLGPDGVLVSNHTSGSATFAFNVCVDASNNLVIGMQEQETDIMKAIVYKISQAGTHVWSSSGVLLGDGLSPYPAALTNGEVVVAWNDFNSNTLEIQKISGAGTLVWSTPVTVTVSGSNTIRGQVVANLNNKFTMVYQKNVSGVSTNLYAQLFDNSGTALYAPLQICDQGTAGYNYYSIAAEGDTTYFGYYSSADSRFNSFLQRINPNGTIPWGMNGSAFNTSQGSGDNYQGPTQIKLTPGSTCVWAVCTFNTPFTNNYGIYMQKFMKSTGSRQLTDMGKEVYPVSSNSNQQAGNLQLHNDQPLFMSYDNYYKLHVTKLDGNGNFVWSYHRTEISSTTPGTGYEKGRFDFYPVGPDRFAGIWTEDRDSENQAYIQGISQNGLFGLDVVTQGSVPAIINTGNGTLQLESVVYPSYANQLAIWSIIPVTGMANIGTTGLVTAIADGTVWAKAIAVQDNTVLDSLLITITDQTPVPPDVVTLPANNIAWYSATLNGSVDANYFNSASSFEWGLTNAYGNTVSATPALVTGGTATPVLANLTGLTHSTTYHYRCKGVNQAGTVNGQDLTFTTDCYLAGTPGTITGTSSLCANSNNVNYSVPAFTGATGYNWSLPAGATIVAGNSTNSIDVDFSAAAQSGNITVTATNGACYSTTSDPFAVTVSNVPVAPGSIVGNQIVCEGDQGIVYTVPPIADATDYVWSVPTGVVITAGSNTNSITVTFGVGSTSGNFTVYGTNSCGTGVTSAPLPVDIAPLPGTVGSITGPTQICAEADNITYSVSPVTNAYGYVWTLSPGAQLVSGANTNLITVNFTSNATSGSFTVYATNGNCLGQTSPALAVSVNPTPATPVITQHGDTLFSSADAGNQWYIDGVLIPGATARTHVAVYVGNYSVIATLNGCSSATSNSILVLPVSTGDVQLVKSIEIYPNPNNGQFDIKTVSDHHIECSLEIYDNVGRIIRKQQKLNINGTSTIHVDLKNVPAGYYMVVLRNNDNQVSRKMAINR